VLIDGKQHQLIDFEHDLFFGGNNFDLQLAEKIISYFNQEFSFLEKHQYDRVYQQTN
jgi:molecular chaperone DnaK (HSP70)